MTTTVDFLAAGCGAYLISEWGDCDPEKWNGSTFIDSGSSNRSEVSFIGDTIRSEEYPPYTLTSLRVAFKADDPSYDGFRRIDLYIDNYSQIISDGSWEVVFDFDPPILSDQLRYIAFNIDYVPVTVLTIEATGTFPGLGTIGGSYLYKETGRSIVEVPAPPRTNDRPRTATSGEGQTKHPSWPNPYQPPANYDSFGSKPYKPPATTTNPPRPKNNRPVNGDGNLEWELVYIPPDPLTGRPGEWKRIPKILDGYSGVLIPFP
jgi:hypothetical protein